MNSVCVNCGDTSGDFILDYTSGDYICNRCGVVQPEQVIDTGKEWRDFENDDKGGDRSRAEKVEDDFKTLGTGISVSNYGSTAASSTAKALSKYSRLASHDKSEQHLKDAFARINELGETLQLPAIIKQTAKEVVKKFEKQRDKNMKGMKKDAFIVAVLLVACKMEQGGRTLKGIARSTNIDEKESKRFYKMLIRDSKVTPMDSRKSTSNEVQELVDVFCNKLQQPYAVAKESKEVAINAMNFLEGKRPSSIAAASILFILNLMHLQYKQQDLANIAGISANTLRNVYKEINKNIDQLPPHLFVVRTIPD